MEVGSRPSVLLKKEGIFIVMKNLHKVWNVINKWQFKHFVLNCRHVMSNVQQYRWWYTSTCRWLEKPEHWILARQRPLFLLQDLFIASKHLHNSKSSCCSLLIWIDILQHFLASFNELKLLRQFQNCYSPVFGLMLIFSASSRAFYYRTSTRSSNTSYWSWEFNNSSSL